MRIYRRKEFLALPAGTAYCKGKEFVFEGLTFKGEGYGMANDWFVFDPAWVDGQDSGECLHRLDEMLQAGASYPMQDSICRDGLYDDDAIFLVFERADLMKLREHIDAAIAVAS